MSSIVLHTHYFDNSNRTTYDQVGAVIKAGQSFVTKYKAELTAQEYDDRVELLIPLHQCQLAAIKGSTTARKALSML